MDGVRNTGLNSRRRLPRRRAVLALVAGAALAGAAVLPANGGAAAGKKQQHATTAGELTYTKQTVLVPAATENNQLAKVSADGTTYTFKADVGALHRLKAGSVMLLPALAVRDVTKVQHSHSRLVVSTTPAAITDLIANGTLSWNRALKFSNGFGLSGSAAAATDNLRRSHTATPSAAARFGLVPMTAGHTITIKGTTHSYKYTAAFKEQGKSVAVTIKISKAAPVQVTATINGTLNNLSSAGRIAISHGALSSAQLVADKVGGKFTLNYTAKSLYLDSLDDESLIELPAEIAVPFSVGPVPMFLGLKVAFVAAADFQELNQKVSGDYAFSFSGDGGEQVSVAGAGTPTGAMNGATHILLNATNATKGMDSLSATFGARLPQLDLGLGVKGLTVAGHLSLLADTGVAYDGLCDTRQALLSGSTGANATFFNLATPIYDQTVFHRGTTAAWPTGCGHYP